jgi:hypothetical protein
VPRPYNFLRLEQYLQDTFALDRERAAVLAAALRVIVIDPRGALGVFHVWTEPGDWDEWLLDLAGWACSPTRSRTARSGSSSCAGSTGGTSRQRPGSS